MTIIDPKSGDINDDNGARGIPVGGTTSTSQVVAVSDPMADVDDSSSSSSSRRSSPSPRRRRLSPAANDDPRHRHDESGDAPDDDEYDVVNDVAREYYPALARALMANTASSSSSSSSSSTSKSANNDNNNYTSDNNDIIDLLGEGARRILIAGRRTFGTREDRVMFANESDDATDRPSPPASSSSSSSSLVDRGGDTRGYSTSATSPRPEDAGLYLRAVSASANALGSALSRIPVTSSSRNDVDLDGSDGAAEHVLEVVAAAGIAASFANSPTVVVRSGIVVALARLIEVATTRRQRSRRRFDDDDDVVINVLTPIHAEFLRVCVLAGQYRIASSFLAASPIHRASLDSPLLRLVDPIASLMRAHYHAGLVHVGCEAWDDALDSFHACLVVPCSVVGPIAVAARKKSLLVRCLLLESDELDGRRDGILGRGGIGPPADDRVDGSLGRTAVSSLEDRVLGLPGAACAAVVKFMSTSSNNRAGGTDSSAAGASGGKDEASPPSAPDRTTTGSETTERSSRRRTRGSNPDHRVSPGGERLGSVHVPSTTFAKIDPHLGEYHDLVSAYIKGNANHYAKLLSGMSDLLRSDGNWELAKRLDSRLLVYRSIRRVASVYSVVGADVLEGKMREVCAREVEKRKVEDALMGMARCDAGDSLLADPFVARMDQSTGMVTFPDESVDGGDEEERRMEADLADRLRSCIALAERVRSLDISLTISPKYQQHAMKEKMTKGDRGSSMTKLLGSSVADIGHGPMGIGDW